MSSATYDAIADRLAKLHPPILIDKYIAKVTNLGATTLDGISFIPKDEKDPKLKGEVKPDTTGKIRDLVTAIMRARNADGGKAFVGKRIDDEEQEHWALKLSFGATKGIGYRGPWRFPELSGRALDKGFGSADRYADQSRLKFGGNFGANLTLPNMTSLHFAVHETGCNVHIDDAGFVMQAPNGNVSLTPDFFQHLFDELLIKTYLRDAMPVGARGFFNRISLIYPNSGNHFSRMGPRIRQVPLLRRLGDVPGLGPVFGWVPLPGISVDLKKVQKLDLKVHATCGINGSCSVGFTFGGHFDWDQSLRPGK